MVRCRTAPVVATCPTPISPVWTPPSSLPTTNPTWCASWRRCWRSPLPACPEPAAPAAATGYAPSKLTGPFFFFHRRGGGLRTPHHGGAGVPATPTAARHVRRLAPPSLGHSHCVGLLVRLPAWGALLSPSHLRWRAPVWDGTPAPRPRGQLRDVNVPVNRRPQFPPLSPPLTPAPAPVGPSLPRVDRKSVV